ncbi:hypothetical protein [Treponema primitia]|uniref:hypothetical protein n=1 Tax=Treponema primitia TaxID=88058 RepID=UPI000255586E|nr:hypothetical protein [Treponema primitia]
MIFDDPKADALFYAIKPFLKKFLVAAPDYGRSGFEIVMRGGEPTLINMSQGITLQPDLKSGK